MRRLRTASMIALVACGNARTTEEGSTMQTPTSPPEPNTEDDSTGLSDGSNLQCRLVVTGTGPYGVAVEVANAGPEAITLAYHFPMTFSLEAKVGGRRIDVRVPRSSMQVLPREMRVEPGEAKTISTPIRLSFVSESDPMSDSGFSFELVHPPARVELRALRAFSDEEIVCAGSLTP